MVNITFYGGVSEIGGNRIELQENKSKIFLDFGMSFSKEGQFFHFPFLRPANKEDLFKLNLLPKLEGLYQDQGYYPEYKCDGTFELKGKEELRRIHAIFLSHAHLDHYGYFGLLREDIPIYMSEVSKRFVELRNKVGNQQWNLYLENNDLRELEKDTEIPIEDFQVKRYDVDHSILGASGYIVKTKDKTVAYTGDFRFHGHRGHLTAEFLKALKNEHIDVLICEGTRIPKPRKPGDIQAESRVLISEKEVFEKCVDIISKEEELIIYDMSAADLDRIRTMWDVAKKTGRKLVIDSRKAYLLLYINKGKEHVSGLPQLDDFLIYLNRQKFRNTNIFQGFSKGREIYAECFEYYRSKHEAELTVKQQVNSDLKKAPKSLVELSEYYNNPDLFEIEDERFVWGPDGRKQILDNSSEYIIITSNGMQTMLQFKPENGKIGGTYIYGKAEPFNEEMRLSFKRLLNWLNICDMKLEYSHTSGHIDIKGMETFLKEVKSSILIPIHSEYPNEFKRIYKGKIHFPSYGIKCKF